MRGSYNRGRIFRNGNSQRQTNETTLQRDRHTNNSNRDDKVIIHVPTSKVGKLIGRAGSKIKEIQNTSQTKININKGFSRDDTTAVEICGSVDAQNSAKSIISDLIGEFYADSQLQQSQCNEPCKGYQEMQQCEQQSSQEEIKQEEHNEEVSDEESLSYEEYQKQKWAAYPPVIKSFYFEHAEISRLTDVDIEQMRLEKNGINVEFPFENKNKTEENEIYIPKLISKFEHAFEKYPDIMREIKKNNFVTPTPIQCQAWPVLLSGHDMIGIAQTGTGKTLAFLLPALIHIDGQKTPRRERTGPSVLIMAPTRELALQIESEVNKYSYKGIKALCTYGGGNRENQAKRAAEGVEIIIATPGRLNDLVQSGEINIDYVSYFVLDEADKMLDMGFYPQITRTLINLRPDRQTVMTSATWPPDVRELASSFMSNPILVSVGTMDLKAVHTVTQKVYIVEEEKKREMLNDFIHKMRPEDKVIIFMGKKQKIDEITQDLINNNVKCQSIHGGREQYEREKALNDLKTGVVNILLATDVASRGIDIEDITHVINYDFPRDIEEYVHRVGRTGRAGRSGVSVSFMTRKDWCHAAELIKILKEANQEIPKALCNMSDRFDAQQTQKNEEYKGRDSRGRGGSRSQGNYRPGGFKKY